MLPAWSRITETWRTRTLATSPLVTVGEWRCDGGTAPECRERLADAHLIVLPRTGVFARDSGERRTLLDANWIAFFEPGEIYQTDRLLRQTFECTWLAVAPQLYAEIVCGLGVQAGAGCADLKTPRLCPPAVCILHAAVLASLAGMGGQVNAREIDEACIRLVRAAMCELASDRGCAGPRRASPPWHAARIDDAKHFLATGFRDRITVPRVSKAAHVSPFHLCRPFRQHTGLSIHRYLLTLRLRAALGELAMGRTPLAALAVALGFSSHSHFTSAFRREYGVRPSAIRRWRTATSAPALHALGAGPEAIPSAG